MEILHHNGHKIEHYYDAELKWINVVVVYGIKLKKRSYQVIITYLIDKVDWGVPSVLQKLTGYQKFECFEAIVRYDY